MIGLILAAGRGSRINNYSKDYPKSLLTLNEHNYTLLDYNLDILEKLNLNKIIIVTGYKSYIIEDHLRSRKNIEIIYNPFWNHCNVLGSMYMALNSINDDFLFLHADTLADIKIWDMLLSHEGDMILPYQRKICGNEEMKVKVINNKITQINKEMDFEESDGEFLGIAKFKYSTLDFFKSKSKELFEKDQLNHYMESVITEAINENKFQISAMDILDNKFIEVDFEDDYVKAKSLFGIYNNKNNK